MKKVFIDGKAGTTGLRIYERLGQRDDIELLTLAEEDRKNAEKRKAALNDADIAFLCLPDDAAVEAVKMIENPNTVVIDTSTAHRTASGWVYGFPELGKVFRQTEKREKDSCSGVSRKRLYRSCKAVDRRKGYQTEHKTVLSFADGLQRRRKKDDSAI